jgi:hypothetical protein
MKLVTSERPRGRSDAGYGGVPPHVVWLLTGLAQRLCNAPALAGRSAPFATTEDVLISRITPSRHLCRFRT